MRIKSPTHTLQLATDYCLLTLNDNSLICMEVRLILDIEVIYTIIIEFLNDFQDTCVFFRPGPNEKCSNQRKYQINILIWEGGAGGLVDRINTG